VELADLAKVLFKLVSKSKPQWKLMKRRLRHTVLITLKLELYIGTFEKLRATISWTPQVLNAARLLSSLVALLVKGFRHCKHAGVELVTATPGMN
jgi:hypothetical protein